MENYLDYIDAYFNKQLSADEVTRFERKIAENKEFAAEVAFYLSAKQELKQEVVGEKKLLFKKWMLQNDAAARESRRPVRNMMVYRLSAVAAAVVFILLGWYLFFSKTSSPSQMANAYIKENLQSLSVKMGTGDSVQNGLRLYNEAHFDSSIRQFEKILQKDTGNDLAKKYLGIVYLRLNNYDKALQYFRQLEHVSLFSNPAIFYQAITLMKRNEPGDKQNAKQLLQRVADGNLEGKEVAQQWLRKW